MRPSKSIKYEYLTQTSEHIYINWCWPYKNDCFETCKIRMFVCVCGLRNIQKINLFVCISRPRMPEPSHQMYIHSKTRRPHNIVGPNRRMRLAQIRRFVRCTLCDCCICLLWAAHARFACCLLRVSAADRQAEKRDFLLDARARDISWSRVWLWLGCVCVSASALATHALGETALRSVEINTLTTHHTRRTHTQH